MTPQKKVLIVDDQVEEILWLLELLQHRGYGVIVVTNGKDADSRLTAIHGGTEDYAAAIFDVMLSTLSIEEIVSSQAELNDDFFKESKDTGLRLCRRAKQLGLTLPIACLTVRKDAEVEAVSDETGIPVYHRIPLDESESIMGFLDRHLPALPGSKAKAPKPHRKKRLRKQ
jgi:CheY-like chemotaxis protein